MKQSKKVTRRIELEADQHRPLTSDDCPTCRQRLPDRVTREAHKHHYPQHFKEIEK